MEIEGKRAKLYFLNESGEWDDHGIGYVELFEGHIVMQREDDNGTAKDDALLLSSPVRPIAEYKIEGGTMLLWHDAQLDQEMALSFEDEAGCEGFYQELRDAPRGPRGPVLREEAIFTPNLPEPDITNLTVVRDRLIVGLQQGRDAVCAAVLRSNFLDKLLDVFEQCEDLDDTENLQVIFTIGKALILMNNVRLLNTLVSDKYGTRFLGILEYDASLPQKQAHRDHMGTVNFREIITLPEAVRCKVKLLYRTQYFKDTATARFLDDATAGILNAIVMRTQNDVVSSMYADQRALRDMCDRLRDSPDAQRVDVLRFAVELLSLTRSLSVEQRQLFFTALYQYGLFEALGVLIHAATPRIRTLATDVLCQAVSQDPLTARKYLKDEDPELISLRNIAIVLVREGDAAAKDQLVDVLKALLGAPLPQALLQAQPQCAPDTIDGEFSAHFAECVLPTLTRPLLDTNRAGGSPHHQALEMIAFCILEHGGYMKEHLIQRSVLGHVGTLLTGAKPNRATSVQISAVHVLKAAVQTKETAFHREIAKKNVFQHVVDVLVRAFTEHKPPTHFNLLLSSLVSIFELIKKENIKVLGEYVMRAFGDKLEPLMFMETMQIFRARWGPDDTDRKRKREGTEEANNQPNVEGKEERDSSPSPSLSPTSPAARAPNAKRRQTVFADPSPEE